MLTEAELIKEWKGLTSTDNFFLVIPSMECILATPFTVPALSHNINLNPMMVLSYF